MTSVNVSLQWSELQLVTAGGKGDVPGIESQDSCCEERDQLTCGKSPDNQSSSKVGPKVGSGAPRKVGQKSVKNAQIPVLWPIFDLLSGEPRNLLSDLLLSYFNCPGISHKLAGRKNVSRNWFL